MRVGAFDLNETFGAYRLVATPRPIEIRRIVQKTNGTFRRVFI